LTASHAFHLLGALRRYCMSMCKLCGCGSAGQADAIDVTAISGTSWMVFGCPDDLILRLGVMDVDASQRAADVVAGGGSPL